MCNTLTVDPKELLDFLTETSGAANVLKIRQVPIVAKMKGEPPVPPTFDVSGGIKDIKAMLEEGRKRGLDLPVLARTLECYEEAKRKGGGEEEISAGVAVYWANRNKR
jgi:3-hydroxyisobutyrate dehydrogenase